MDLFFQNKCCEEPKTLERTTTSEVNKVAVYIVRIAAGVLSQWRFRPLALLVV